MEKESDSVPSSSTTALFDFSGDIHGLFCGIFSLTGRSVLRRSLFPLRKGRGYAVSDIVERQGDRDSKGEVTE